MNILDAALWLTAGLAFLLLFALPWLNGLLDLLIGYRFHKRAVEGGAPIDTSAFVLNWIAFKWLWIHNAVSIVVRIPFFRQDLSKTFGIKTENSKW